MLKRLLKDSATYGIGRIAAVLLSFATLPILTSHLSTTEYGIVDLLILCVTLFNLSVALEISQGVARFIGDVQSPKEKSLYTSTALFFSISMYSIAGILIFIFYQDISRILFGTTTYQKLVLFLIPWFILHGVNYFVINQLRWENRVWSYVILRTLNGMIMLLSVIWLLKHRNMGVEAVLYSYILSLGITTILATGFLIYYKSLRLNFCKGKLKEMLTFSFPLVPSSAAIFVQNYIDRIMITNMLDLQSLGLYSFAFKIASAVTLVSVAFQMSVTPLVYQLHKKKDTPLQIAKSFNIYLLCVFITILGICLFTVEFFYFFIGKSFYSSAYLIPILCFSVVFSSVCVFAPGMAIAKKTKLIANINIIGMFLNIVLNIIFIKYYGIIGAAIATAISLAIVALMNFILSSKYYSIPYFYSRIFIGTLVTTLSVLWIGLYQNIGEFSVDNFIIKVILYIVLSVVLFIIFINIKMTVIKKYILRF